MVSVDVMPCVGGLSRWEIISPLFKEPLETLEGTLVKNAPINYCICSFEKVSVKNCSF